MRDESYILAAGLFDPLPPFQPVVGERPGGWTIRDAAGIDVGAAKTRAGARAAVRALYSQKEQG